MVRNGVRERKEQKHNVAGSAGSFATGRLRYDPPHTWCRVREIKSDQNMTTFEPEFGSQGIPSVQRVEDVHFQRLEWICTCVEDARGSTPDGYFSYTAENHLSGTSPACPAPSPLLEPVCSGRNTGGEVSVTNKGRETV